MYKIALEKGFIEKFQKDDSNILLSQWDIQENEFFEQGALLFCIETEKALFEIYAEQKGYVKQILLDPGELLGSDSILAIILDHPNDSKLPKELQSLPLFPTNLAEEE